jgi:septal ring factor EnvC (AmiA/AmiB activator)
MFENEQALGHVPRVTEDDLERNINELQSRLDSLIAQESEDEREQAKVLEVLLRNRRNLMDLLRSGRFI